MAERIYVLPPRSVDDELDYAVDWSAWLSPGETIVDKRVTVTAGNTTASRSAIDGTRVTFWLSGGTGGAMTHRIEVGITTSAGRKIEVTTTIAVRG